jgi:glycosyltransferase involved in cell wall biosynthesis
VRVAIVNLTRGGLSGGYAKYLRRLVPLLAGTSGIDSLDVFIPAPARERFRDVAWTPRVWPADDGRRGFSQLKGELRERRPDVLFIPTAAWLDAAGTPVVAMVRNMEPLEVPFGGNPWSEAVRNLARRFAARRACRRATRVIAVSTHVRDYLTRRWALPPDKIGVVHHGVDVPHTDRAPVRPAAIGPEFDRPFVFAAGSLRPARGLDDLIEALPLLRNGTALAAIVAGAVDAGMEPYYQGLRRRADDLGVADRIVWVGALGDAEMRWCYEACAAFVMTSRAEACPNIALEAMSYGCACVSVNRQPMPEMFGAAAAYYSLGDPAALARTLGDVLASPVGRADLKTAATARARSFDWRITAEKTVAELRAALAL